MFIWKCWGRLLCTRSSKEQTTTRIHTYGRSSVSGTSIRIWAEFWPINLFPYKVSWSISKNSKSLQWCCYQFFIYIRVTLAFTLSPSFLSLPLTYSLLTCGLWPTFLCFSFFIGCIVDQMPRFSSYGFKNKKYKYKIKNNNSTWSDVRAQFLTYIFFHQLSHAFPLR